MIIDGEEEYKVDDILNSQIKRRRLEYLAKRTDYEHTNWIDARNVNELWGDDHFHALYPGSLRTLLNNS